jgi:uncharacterized beta barrel domain-containing protein DUF5777
VTRLTFMALVLTLSVPSYVGAQQQDDDAAVFKPAQPDFTLVGLPTGLRLPKFKSAFRVTHRFTRALGDGDFGSLAEDFFGLDSGAQIGLEYRFGIMRNAQIGINRINNRTIQFFALYDLIRQERLGVEVSALGSIDGTNNFRDSYSPALGAVLSRTIGEYVGLYVEPIWINNTNQLPERVVDNNDTFIVGIGARVRVRPTVYVVGEVSPRPSGYKPGVTQGSFGLEKRQGGHVFQVNFSNSFGTTMSQIARGGPEENNWFLGFNISRKFY